MLPDFRVIAISVVATIMIMMLGFGLFAALRIANQASAKLLARGETPLARVFPETAPAPPRVQTSIPPLEERADPLAEVPEQDIPIAVSVTQGRISPETAAPVGGPLVVLDAAAAGLAARSSIPDPQINRAAANVTGSIYAGTEAPVAAIENKPADIALAVEPPSSPSTQQPPVVQAVPPMTTNSASPKPVTTNAAPPAKQVARTGQVRKPRARRLARAPAKPAQTAADPFAVWFTPPPPPPRTGPDRDRRNRGVASTTQ